MAESFPSSGVKAIIIRDCMLLCVRKRDEAGIICSFPGGKQEMGETLEDAVRREVLEEAGAEIDVGPLAIVREYIGKNHEFAVMDAAVHVTDHLFLCSLHDPGAHLVPQAPDPDQDGVEWLPIDQLEEYPFRPRALISHVREMARDSTPSGAAYVGDVN